MNLALSRLFFTKRSTCGELFVEGQIQRFCYTLELPVKDGLPGSAIPPGRYKIELAASPKFMNSRDTWVAQYAAQMPHIICPPRSLIMIHWLNDPTETDGCVGVGYTHDLDFIGESRAAFEALFALIEGAAAVGDCWIDVQGGTAQTADLSLQGDV